MIWIQAQPSSRLKVRAWACAACMLLLCAAALPAQAQPEVPPAERGRHGVFGGPTLTFSTIHGQPALFLGGRAGWILNRRLAIGGGGYALLSGVEPNVITCPCGEPIYIKAGYGGLDLAYLARPFKGLQASAQVLLGAGGVGYYHEDHDHGDLTPEEHFQQHPYIHDDDVFFVAEPGLHLTIGLTRFLRIGGGLSYRFTRGIALTGIGDASLSGLSGTVSFNVGAF